MQDWASIRLVIGTRYRKRKNCQDAYKHEWVAHVTMQPSDDIFDPTDSFCKIVENVCFRLPSAGMEHMSSVPGENEISLKFYSDGCFVLPVRIHLNKALGIKPVLQEHMHVFQKAGGQRYVELSVRAANLKKVLNNQIEKKTFSEDSTDETLELPSLAMPSMRPKADTNMHRFNRKSRSLMPSPRSSR